MITILRILPRELGVNGDAQNALVLAQRARWSGLEARVVDTASDRPDAVVIGSGVDSVLHGAAAHLQSIGQELRSWIADGTRVVAVGSGLELLTEVIRFGDGTELAGLGVVAGRAVPSTTRVSDDLVVSSRFGRLIGFENHARDLKIDDGEPLGQVISGRGNGDGTDGVVSGPIIGTHLHGPVLAKNPGLADSILSAIDPAYSTAADRIRAVDETARAARNAIATRLELELE